MTDDYAGGPYLLNVTATMSGWDKPQDALPTEILDIFK